MRLLLRFFGLLFAAGTIIFIVAVAAAAGLLWHYSQSLPDYSQLQDYEPAVMTRVHAADGSLLAEYARERRGKSRPRRAWPAGGAHWQISRLRRFGAGDLRA